MKKQNNKKRKQTKSKRTTKNIEKNKYNSKKKNFNINKSRNINKRKELLAKARINDSEKMPNDLSFCFVGQLAKKNKGFGFVEPIDNDKLNELSKRFKIDLKNFNEDIYIPKEYSLNANNEDYVLARIIDQKRHYEGKIIKILERNTNNITGIYEENINFGFVKPTNRSYSTDIYIKQGNNNGAKNGDAVLVQILKFPEKDKKTEGKILKVITNKEDPLLDLKLILAENNIDEDFPDKVKKELENLPNEVYDHELKHRTDYTGLRTYTIDGETAKDYDDAISIKKTGNIYHLYVHIADVSHYVKEDSEIDQEARLRGFSLYLINKVIPMLDFKISNNICSLKEGSNRLTLTVYLKIDNNGDIIHKNISESYINVNRRMTYTLVQDILDKKIEDRDYKDFKAMEELALILKRKRKEKGNIDFNLPEPEFIINEEGKIIDIKAETKRFSSEIIEQFMVLTNEVVGSYMKNKNLPVIYRVHEEPDIDKVLELKEVVEALGFKIDFLNNKKYIDSKKAYRRKIENNQNNQNNKYKNNINNNLSNMRTNLKKQNKEAHLKSNIKIEPKEFSSFLDKLKGNDLEEIISGLLLRTMRLAKYNNIDLGHFGLATNSYSHFTAPIRRYTDLFIHRILKKSLNNTLTINEKNQYLKQAKIVADGASLIETKLTNIEREYHDIKSAEFMENKIGYEYDGTISAITNFGIYVKIFNAIEGLIRYVNMEDYIEFDEITRQAKAQQSNKIYKLGDKVKIKISAVDLKEGNIDFEFV